MNALYIAEKSKQVSRHRGQTWDPRLNDNLDLITGASARNRPDGVADRSNRLAPSATADSPRPMREERPTAPNLDDQRRALLALLAQLQGNAMQVADAALSGCGIETTCASPDTADRAGEVCEQDLAVSVLGSVTATLSQIETALEHIDDGSYGRCIECGERIPAVRLEAIPYATRCVQCAARQERAA